MPDATAPQAKTPFLRASSIYETLNKEGMSVEVFGVRSTSYDHAIVDTVIRALRRKGASLCVNLLDICKAHDLRPKTLNFEVDDLSSRYRHVRNKQSSTPIPLVDHCL